MTDDVGKAFDALADTYDNVGVDFFQPIAAGLVDELDPRPGERTLDIGCGRSAVLLRLAGAVGPDGRAVGIDASVRMVELARQEAADRGLDVEVAHGDAQAVDLPARSFDVLTSSLVLFFLPDPLGAVEAWRDLLVDGGRLGVSTFGAYDDRWAEEVDGTLATHLPAHIADARTTGRTGPFASDEAMEELLSTAGYRQVRTASRTVSPRFEDTEHWFRWSMSVGQRRMWMAIPEDQRDDVIDEVGRAVERCRKDDGKLGFDQRVRYTLGVR